MGVIIETYALISSVPLITFFFIYYMLYFLGKSKRKAFLWTVYVTSILLYSAVTAQIKFILHMNSGYLFTFSWIILIILSLGFLQRKLKGQLDIAKIIDSTLKLSFFTFGFFYIILFIIGVFTI